MSIEEFEYDGETYEIYKSYESNSGFVIQKKELPLHERVEQLFSKQHSWINNVEAFTPLPASRDADLWNVGIAAKTFSFNLDEVEEFDISVHYFSTEVDYYSEVYEFDLEDVSMVLFLNVEEN